MMDHEPDNEPDHEEWSSIINHTSCYGYGYKRTQFDSNDQHNFTPFAIFHIVPYCSVSQLWKLLSTELF